MHSKLTKFLCLQLQFIPDLSRFLSTNCQQTELQKKSNAASISGSFRHVVDQSLKINAESEVKEVKILMVYISLDLRTLLVKFLNANLKKL